MPKRLKGLAPIVNSRTKVLILGSFPSVASLGEQRYYAHRQNQFWKIMARLLGSESSYKKLLLKNRIALWDVVKSCVRDGSSDNNILRPEYNEIAGLLKSHPKIKAVFFNGRTAEKLFIKACPKLSREISVRYLPSTSPANAGHTFEYKLRAWRKILGNRDEAKVSASNG